MKADDFIQYLLSASTDRWCTAIAAVWCFLHCSGQNFIEGIGIIRFRPEFCLEIHDGKADDFIQCLLSASTDCWCLAIAAVWCFLKLFWSKSY